MTITIGLTNPAEHQPSELRALAVFLNNLAEDRETGRIAYKPAFQTLTAGTVSKTEASAVPAAPAVEVAAAPAPLPPAAPSASEPTTPPPAPVASVPPAPATLSGVELDSAGLPWDGRIHAESKGKIADGTWRKKRGADPALVAEVEARLRELVAIPAAPTTDSMGGSLNTPNPAPAEVPPAPAAPVAEEVPPAPPAPVTMPPAEEVPPAPPAPVAATVTIADVFKFATAAEKAGTLTPDARTAALAGLGLNSMVELSARPDLAAAVIESFKQFGAE